MSELAALVDLPERTVRYYIQLGLVDRPDGETRAARYGTRHLEQLIAIRRWQQAGLSLQRISELLAHPARETPPLRPRAAGTVEVCSHLVVADGVELVVEPGRAQLTTEQVRRLFGEVTAAFERIRREDR
ncbi:MAG: helix-turn-helix domain-containing protein [Burkholderiaceae bacterium]|nr:helix-turn-helix domain-containing protein [Burkholderiaceae bacterium]